MDKIITVNRRYISAEPMYAAVRYFDRVARPMWLGGIDIPNPLERFAMQLLMGDYNLTGSGTANRPPDDVAEILTRLRDK
jgi:hypothetical protein